MARKATEQVTRIGIDIGKNSFHLIGLDAEGNMALRRKLSRSQVLVRLAKIAPCLIGMEALCWRASSEPTASGAGP
jgi:transposase